MKESLFHGKRDCRNIENRRVLLTIVQFLNRMYGVAVPCPNEQSQEMQKENEKPHTVHLITRLNLWNARHGLAESQMRVRFFIKLLPLAWYTARKRAAFQVQLPLAARKARAEERTKHYVRCR